MRADDQKKVNLEQSEAVSGIDMPKRESSSECCECRQDIRSGAIRCHHCTAVQGWRRLLRLPLIICGFALTIVSIWAAEPIKKILDSEKAYIQPSILDGDYDHIKIVLTNTGSRSATLDYVEIWGDTEEGYPSTWILKTAMDGQVIEPSKSYPVDASNGELIPAFIDRFRSDILRQKFGTKENCRLRVVYLDVNDRESVLLYPFLCDPISANPYGGMRDKEE